MADNCSLIRCIGLANNFIYFEEQTVMDADSFIFSKPVTRHLCYSPTNQFLILNSEGQLEVKNLTATELLHPESKFNIRIYRELSREDKQGRPVILYANNNQKKMVVCCGNNEIHTEEMDPPEHIDESMHRALFYMVSESKSYTYMFESTMHPKCFLAFKPENGLLKLVLKEKKDEVDESCQLFLGSN